ncbi:unnamed protein product [Clonostachys solani]|uniref:2EXR domain-containing protein n=1 Tax=Clonostachys solani TaxID=160281 RepID=A0A9N9VX92_9HYPO|nr:unnamed protein product [Clonostachys solani]
MAKSFTNFPNLPMEIQLKIWKLAACNVAESDREIRVELHCHLRSTSHSCWTGTGQFCGHHGTCPTYLHGPRDGSWATFCLSDGYFTQPETYASISDPFAQRQMASLSLACRNSRAALHREFPTEIRIYEGKWRRGVQVLTLRCNPEKDTLVLIDVHMPNSRHVQPGIRPLTADAMSRAESDRIARTFPRDPEKFAACRSILSSFRTIAIQQDGHRGRTGSENIDLINIGMLVMLFMESITGLYVWPNPELWPEVWKSPCRIEDVKLWDYKDELGRGGFVEEVDYFLREYDQWVDVHHDHFAPSGEHWAPLPRKLSRVGCYVWSA